MANSEELRGLGGWLVLVGIGLVVAPLRILHQLVTIYPPIFEDGTWSALSSPESMEYIPYFAPLIVFEITFNALMLVASIALVAMYFWKHYLFPRTYIALMLISLIFFLLDGWLVSLVFPGVQILDEEGAAEFAQLLVASLIWIPYMLLSKRVRATFVQSGTIAPAQSSRVLVD